MSTNPCPHCGTPNPGQAQFCASCGKPIAGHQAAAYTPACPRCNTPLRTSARFCPSCGYDMMQQAAPGGVTPGAQGAEPATPPGGSGAGVPGGGSAAGTQLLGSESFVTALVVRWMGGSSQRYPLKKPVISAGRAPENDIVINHPAVSGHHLNISVSGGQMMITDLKSTNGTQLNGHRIPPSVPQNVQAGDIVRIGDLTGNWVGLALEGAAGEAVRQLSLGKLDLSNLTNVIIGRDPSCYLPLNHPTVSARHATIFKQDGGLMIRDLGSTNGTFVNGQRVAQAPLKSGDEIQIGPFKLSYDAQQQSLAQSMRMGHRIDAMKLGREVGKKKMILQDVSLTVNPGEFVAFVGGSGAGKSTLMKAMNGYEPANHGNLLLDGAPLYSRLDLYRTAMGYVPQDDIIHRVLPVKLALWYAAKLRMPDARPAEIHQRIQDSLKAVDMVEHADKPVKILSGGQRKRVSIAVELLAKPTLFFLDEPTSGLDPGLEKKMMYDMNRLADDGRTIILVTHATANIEQCDQVAFLSKGFLSYYGPPNEALKFFNVRDFSDIYLKLSEDVDPQHNKPAPPELQPYYHPRPGTSGKVNAGILWAQHYRQSPQFKQYVADRQTKLAGGKAAIGATAPPPRRAKDSFIRQAILLARRQFDLTRMDMRTLFIILLMVPLIGFMFMSVSNADAFVGKYASGAEAEEEMKDDLDGKAKDSKGEYIPVADAEILTTMLSLALTQTGTFAAAYEIVKERAIFRRERAVNLNVFAYVLSKIIVLGAFAVIQVLSLILILSLKLDLGIKGAIFDLGIIEIAITMYLAILASICFGLFISAIVPSQDVVLYAILAQLFIQIVFCGTMFPMEENPAMKGTVAYWIVDSFGSTVDMVKLDEDARVCSVVESVDMNTGQKKLETMCDSAKRDPNKFLNYEHSEEHIIGTWAGLGVTALVWTILTVVVQARKKTE